MRRSILFCLLFSGPLLMAHDLLKVGTPIPEVLDLSSVETGPLLVKDPRDPAQVESVRRAWTPILKPFEHAKALRLKLPPDEGRLPLLLTANQMLKAQEPEMRLYLAYDAQAPSLWNSLAWGALEGGILSPEDLGPAPGRWRELLAKAQRRMPGRPWTLFLPSDPGPLLSSLLGDGGQAVVPAGGAGADLAAAIPEGFTEVEGGRGRLVVRSSRTGETKCWSYSDGAWRPSDLSRHAPSVEVSAKAPYDVEALLARVRSTQLRDRMAIQTLEARLDVQVYIRPEKAQEVSVELNFSYFDRIGEKAEALQNVLRLNGVSSDFRIPIVEGAQQLTVPGVLSAEEHYRYSDGGAYGAGRRWIRFTPNEADPRLYRGRMLVDEKSGRILEEHDSRNALPGTVKSEERVLTYGEPAPGLWCLVKVDSREQWFWQDGLCQVQRIMKFADFTINGEAFAAHRDGARASSGTMMIQTPEGVRYFTAQADGTREIDGKSKSHTISIGGGAYIDPRLDSPLAFWFLIYHDFNVREAGIGLNAFLSSYNNTADVHFTRLPGGLDLSLGAHVMAVPLTELPVKDGKVVDAEGMDHQSKGGLVTLGRDLGAGFRLEACLEQKNEQWRQTRNGYVFSQGYSAPAQGWQRSLQGTLRWRHLDFQTRLFSLETRRPAGVYGYAEDPDVIPNQGRAQCWGLSASLNHAFDSRWQIRSEAGFESGRGYDRFLSLPSVSRLTAMKALPASDRAEYLEAGLSLPSGENARVSLTMAHERLRAVDDLKTYGFSNMTLSGNFSGFEWLTSLQLNLNIGLRSDVIGAKGLNGTLVLLRTF